jgi:hypothetical protein
MVKPAPTRTKSKAPISLSPVKALSGTLPPEAPAAKTPAPAPVAAPAPQPKVESAVKPAPAATMPVAAPAEAKPAVAKPAEPKPAAAEPKPATVKPAPAAPVVAKAAPAAPAVAKPASAKPASAKPAAGKTETPKAPVKIAPRAIKPGTTTQIASTKVRRETPAAKPAAKVQAPASAAVTAAAPPAVAKTVAAATAAVETVAAASAKVAQAAAETVKRTVDIAPPKPAAPVAARATPPASLIATPLPRPPEFAAIASTTVMTQTLAMAKAFGALQASMLDHACAELKATLGDVEKLARTDSAADAVALQAKAVRRSYDSYSEHLKELARIASKAVGRD